jgi:hypothetical protein
VNSYEIWIDLAPGVRDMEFVAAVHGYAGWFVKEGYMAGYRIRRRKFGFGPDALGEFCLTLEFETLALMDEAFMQAARRSGELEGLHREVYSRVTNYKSALYRDFPDAVREG